MKFNRLGLGVMACLSVVAVSAHAEKSFRDDAKPATPPSTFSFSGVYGDNLIESRMIGLPDGKDLSILINGKVVNHFVLPVDADLHSPVMVAYQDYIAASAQTITKAGARVADFGLLAPGVAPPAAGDLSAVQKALAAGIDAPRTPAHSGADH